MQLQSRDTLDHTVYKHLKEMIIKKIIKPGELIIQNKLSQTMGVSRTPLRKALGELEKEGLLEGSPKGWYVKEFTAQDMVSIFEIRAVLEGLACRLAADQLEAADLAYMRTMFEYAYEQMDEYQAEAYYKADIKFHSMIIDIAADSMLKQTITSHQIIFTSQIQGLYRDPKVTYHEHIAIMDALTQRDGDLAEKLMREHIQKAIPVIKSNDFSVYK